MKWKTKTRQFSLIFLLGSLALALFSFTTPPAQATANLAPMPDSWEQWGAGTTIPYLFVDKIVTHGGHASLRMERDPNPYGTTGRDGFIKEPNDWIRIKPGDHIVFQCWMKTDTGDGKWAGGGEYYSGSRIGIDFYNNAGWIEDTSALNGNPYQTEAESMAAMVRWNTPTWTLRRMEFIVLPTYAGKVPTGMIPWIQTVPRDNTGHGWFADAELYINPSATPSKLYFNDGFESGDKSLWTTTYSSGRATTVQSSIKYAGTYALDADIPLATGAYASTVKTFDSAYSTFYANAYVRFSALPTLGNYLMVNPTICDSGNRDLVAVYIQNSAGIYRWALEYKTNALARNWVFSSTPTPTINTWYNLEVKFVGGVGTGEARLWVNGVERCTITGLTNNNALAQQVQVGAYSPSALAVHVYTDSVVVDSNYIGGSFDTTSPTYSNVAHNTTIAEQTAKFSAKWQDNVALSGYKFSWNGTGSWTNNTWTALGGSIAWANATKTLPTSGTKVGYRWYANDTANNWAIASPFSFTVVGTPPPSITTISRTPTTPNYSQDASVTAEVTDDKAVDRALLYYTYDGTWHNVIMKRFENLFSASIPAQRYGTLVLYKIYANDTDHHWTVSSLFSYIVIDDVPPQIRASGNPMRPRPNQQVKILANVTEPVNASGLKGVVIFHYRVNNDPWWNTSMTFNASLGLWQAIIPGYSAHDILEYYIKAVDNAGNENTFAGNYTVALA